MNSNRKMNAAFAPSYIDTTGFFRCNIPLWEQIFREYQVESYLEIGTCEGASLFWLAERFCNTASLKATVVDDWRDFHNDGESRYFRNFKANLELSSHRYGSKLSVEIFRDISKVALPRLLSMGRSNFYDLAYIDGDHTASNVLFDCVLCFELVRVGGLLVFDDYIWGYGNHTAETPKIAIDSFLSCFSNLIKPVFISCQQVIVLKVKEKHFEGRL